MSGVRDRRYGWPLVLRTSREHVEVDVSNPQAAADREAVD
jgi:hypothetical protein